MSRNENYRWAQTLAKWTREPRNTAEAMYLRECRLSLLHHWKRAVWLQEPAPKWGDGTNVEGYLCRTMLTQSIRILNGEDPPGRFPLEQGDALEKWAREQGIET